MTTKSHGEVMLALLRERAAEGATGADIKAATRATVSCYITRYLRIGRIGYIDIPTARPRGVQSVRRYFLREHCPPGAVVSEVDRQPRVVKRRLDPIAAEPDDNTVKIRPRGAPVLPVGEARITERTKVTIWQATPDPRRAIGHVEPFFSAGKRLEPRPWAEAVAGGGR